MNNSSAVDLKRLKQKEIERKLLFMRADSPPKSLFKATSFDKLLEVDDSFKKSKTNVADQFIEKGILNDQVYEDLKKSIKRTSSNQRMNQQSSPLRQSFLSQMAMSGETTSNKLLSPEKSSSIARQSSMKQSYGFEESYSPSSSWESHPMVKELSQRALTDSASKRKLQSNVKREVENTFLHNAGLSVLHK